jgi:hypothetical protein
VRFAAKIVGRRNANDQQANRAGWVLKNAGQASLIAHGVSRTQASANT